MAATVIVPNKSGTLYRSSAHHNKIALCDILTNCGPIVTLACPASAMLVLTARKLTPVSLISAADMARYYHNIRGVAQAVADGKLKTLAVCDKVARVFEMIMNVGDHPLVATMSSFRGTNPYRIRELIAAIIDPRLFTNDKSNNITKIALRRALSYLGVAPRVISRILTHKATITPHVERAQSALRSWYSASRVKAITSSQIHNSVLPQPDNNDDLYAADDYFWRYWHNQIHGGRSAANAAYATTRRFCILLLKLWSAWLGVYNFEPNLYFRYKCEQQFIIEKMNQWQQSVSAAVS